MTRTDGAVQEGRVQARIGEHVLAFVHQRLRQRQPEFRLQELTDHVRQAMGGAVAPDSPRRILNALRREGRLEYELLSRQASLYRVIDARSQGQPSLRRWGV